MFDPVIHFAVLVSPGLLLLLSVALAVLVMAMLFGLIEANVILRAAAWVTITFVGCGLVTALLGLLLFGFLYSFGKEVVLLQLCIVLTLVGVLAIAIPFLPDAWLGGDAASEPSTSDGLSLPAGIRVRWISSGTAGRDRPTDHVSIDSGSAVLDLPRSHSRNDVRRRLLHFRGVDGAFQRHPLRLVGQRDRNCGGLLLSKKVWDG